MSNQHLISALTVSLSLSPLFSALYSLIPPFVFTHSCYIFFLSGVVKTTVTQSGGHCAATRQQIPSVMPICESVISYTACVNVLKHVCMHNKWTAASAAGGSGGCSCGAPLWGIIQQLELQTWQTQRPGRTGSIGRTRGSGKTRKARKHRRNGSLLSSTRLYWALLGLVVKVCCFWLGAWWQRLVHKNPTHHLKENPTKDSETNKPWEHTDIDAMR